MKVEANLRREIVGNSNPCRRRSWKPPSRQPDPCLPPLYPAEDFELSKRRIDEMQRMGRLAPPVLVSLMREGPAARTAFKIAFARLTDVEFDVIERMVESQDLDTTHCYAAERVFDRALFVSLAVGLDRNDRALMARMSSASSTKACRLQAAQRASASGRSGPPRKQNRRFRRGCSRKSFVRRSKRSTGPSIRGRYGLLAFGKSLLTSPDAA